MQISRSSPPLRTDVDREALIQGLKDGTIDMVTSDHNPIDIENKKVEFENALFGTIGLESAFGALHTIFSTEEAIKLLTSGMERFAVTSSPIEVGSPANLSLFCPDFKRSFNLETVVSTSKNSIFLGKDFIGKAVGVVNNGTLILKS